MEDQQQHFVSLIEQNKALIYKFCYMYANEADTPQDLFQEVIINLWKGYPTFRGDCKVQTWIYRIALNTCVTFMRKSGSRPKTTALSEDLIVYDDATDASQIKELYTLINRLNEIEKAIVLLYLEERSYDEIAQIVGITRNNVGVRINRIKEKLSQMSNC
ncbi:RNA polymerase sigma factor [Paludibacter jiangxiensis]|uniref:RNA polymerase sigma-70 factor, ECF subfamily n=1 Tax=Paludibacter jiangxiensis TaxID=681398 RepID=A0A161L989_9BACT|nr:sigma-70 family RNA polymerase sigma factor [Paludibacter jiangxiensis]GAT63984.1 RNA polymerase sigma-70 factor, ECF subfamily [Paludibacter jiangxiensis]